MLSTPESASKRFSKGCGHRAKSNFRHATHDSTDLILLLRPRKHRHSPCPCLAYCSCLTADRSVFSLQPQWYCQQELQRPKSPALEAGSPVARSGVFATGRIVMIVPQAAIKSAALCPHVAVSRQAQRPPRALVVSQAVSEAEGALKRVQKGCGVNWYSGAGVIEMSNVACLALLSSPPPGLRQDTNAHDVQRKPNQKNTPRKCRRRWARTWYTSMRME